MMLDRESINLALSILLMANAKIYREDESNQTNEFDDALIKHVAHVRDQPIFIIMREKKIKQASKEIAIAGWRAFEGATNSNQYRQARNHLAETVNDIIRVTFERASFDIMLNALKPVLAVPKKFNINDFEFELGLILPAIGRAVRKELTVEGLYKGSID